jgi:drug/metabolite transporter (DMT)-like permease
MLVAGIAFLPASALHHEFANFDISKVPAQSWMAVIYLIFFGSIAAFTAYVWLLQVRPATQVSTHSYVNPVIAVLLGVMFAQEHISWLQIGGLVIILVSVLLINLAKYRKDANEKKQVEQKPEKIDGLLCKAV